MKQVVSKAEDVEEAVSIDSTRSGDWRLEKKKTKSSRSNGEKKPIDSMKVADIVDLNQKLSASRPNQSKHGMKMTDDEQAYLEPLYLKYGDKLMKMVRDHKLNYKQWTKNQLNRRLKRYKLINGL